MSEAFVPAQVKPAIAFAEIERLDIRVGTILSVAEVNGSDKLVRLTVDFGDRQRNILVGMKNERENPKEIEGCQALFVVNLEPKKMMGEISEGMLLISAMQMVLKSALAVPERQMPNGTRAG